MSDDWDDRWALWLDREAKRRHFRNFVLLCLTIALVLALAVVLVLVHRHSEQQRHERQVEQMTCGLITGRMCP